MSHDPSGIPLVVTQDQLNGAVTEATRAAVKAVFNRKLVVYLALGWLTGLASSAAIAIPVVLVRTHEVKIQAHHEIRHNCEVSASARPQSNARAFVQKITVELAEDAFRAFPPVFQAAEVSKINKRLKHERQAPGELPPRITSLDQLAKTIHPVPLINCAQIAPD